MDSANRSAARFNLAPGLKPESFRAAEIGLHRVTLLRARARGELGFVTIGGRVFYTGEHIAEWLERNERPATSRGKAA